MRGCQLNLLDTLIANKGNDAKSVAFCIISEHFTKNKGPYDSVQSLVIYFA